MTVDLAQRQLEVEWDTSANPNRVLLSSARLQLIHALHPHADPDWRLRLSTPALASGHRHVSQFQVRDAATGKVLPLQRGGYELPLQQAGSPRPGRGVSAGRPPHRTLAGPSALGRRAERSGGVGL